MATNYQIYDPVRITADNFSAFDTLLARQESGELMPADIADFAKNFKDDAFTRIKGPERLLFKNPDVQGAFVEVMMWTADKANPDDPSKMAMLFLDVVPAGEGKFSFEPRRWLLGAGVQAVIPYQMTCCAGFSAIAAYKQDGRMTPALLENQNYVREIHRDLFRLTAEGGESGLGIDPDGGVLAHWHAHLTRQQGHVCHGHKPLATPARLRAFQPA